MLVLQPLPLGDLDGDVCDGLALPQLDVRELKDDGVGRGVVPRAS